MTGNVNDQQPNDEQGDPLVQATIDSLIGQRERALNEAAEAMARGQVLSQRLKDAEDELLSLRDEHANCPVPGTTGSA